MATYSVVGVPSKILNDHPVSYVIQAGIIFVVEHTTGDGYLEYADIKTQVTILFIH